MKPRCPLVRFADQARKGGENLLRAIHQLRRSMAACQTCPLHSSCIQRGAFTAELEALIAEINEEWLSAEDSSRLPNFLTKEQLTDG